VNLFFENSTRTRNSFEIAEKRLSAEIINFDADSSSLSKGETLVDTAMNLGSMRPDLIVMRHSAPGAHALLARHMKASIVNAGDGRGNTPPRPCWTPTPCASASAAWRACGWPSSAISATAGWCDPTYGFSPRWAPTSPWWGPHPDSAGLQETWPEVELSNDLDAALPTQDAIMTLRCQFERGTGAYIPSQGEYARFFQLNAARLQRCKPDVAVLHPGPINRAWRSPPRWRMVPTA